MKFLVVVKTYVMILLGNLPPPPSEGGGETLPPLWGGLGWGFPGVDSITYHLTTIKFLCAILSVFCLLAGGMALPARGNTDIIVSAAASLTNAMTDIGDAFQQAHPNITIVVNFASSGSLVQQMKHGAPVDVFASASQRFMKAAEDAGLIDPQSRQDFARNTLVLAVPSASALAIAAAADLARDDVRLIGIGQPDSVPAGRYAKDALELAGLWELLEPKMVLGNSVRQVLEYLRRNEVDAGLIYATDAVIGGKAVQVVETLETGTAIIYPVALTTRTQHTEAASLFLNFLLGEQGQNILRDYGFSAP